ncbi:MAG: leucine--tRNA ligase [Candidatus Marinimicrobia bacterium CG08_land_8_20_14_0_20_45_22]|nr:MAG: leucine--tRNA ligase [Candidatus Marinimicrobia bacterium CG08_land_8_20_14_0_20_45_22]
MGYPFKEIEKKWQKYWEDNKTFKAVDFSEKPKYYVLDMFPYPSGAGLHVGHPEGYIATDIIARYKRKKGFNVLHPMGWDAFGLPAENYALQTRTHPKITTQRNIDTFRRQIKSFGFSYDWDREINTTDPKYYKWTQWIFQQLYKKGLVYQAEIPVNWCPELKTVLANEEVIDGKSERGGFSVVRIPMRQWILKITAYADRLLSDLDLVDLPESIKEMQRNWIGRSEGAMVTFKIAGHDQALKVFTTRPDTLFGATYMVVAPEHPILDKLVPEPFKSVVENYCIVTSKKSDLERIELTKDKTGVFTGFYAINPLTNRQIPVWTSDYVLMTYGTGAIMAVPGHDQRDWEFAKKFGIDIIEVISGGDITQESYTGNGILVNSGFLNGMDVVSAKKKITDWLVDKGIGEFSVQYKLRDWTFSRQRYWGEPFPFKIFQDGSVELLKESELPLELPEMERYEPSGTGESPLANLKEWNDFIDPETGKRARYETNTMPQWAGSCWYYLRYIDPNNDSKAWDSKKEKYWMPIDLYIGGAEHAVLHLLYARFWHKVLYDLGFVSTPEPFLKLINQGMILGEDGEKMSKSRGNVINPDDVISKYGADTFRIYEMFMGPLTRTKPWNTSSIEGVYRFLSRIWNIILNDNNQLLDDIQDVTPNSDTLNILHKTIQKVTEDIENFHFNTAISQLMIFINEISALEIKPLSVMLDFIDLLSPFAPHISEEIFVRLSNSNNFSYKKWPTYDPNYIKEDVVTIAIQVNGKIRGQFDIKRDATDEECLNLSFQVMNVKRFTDGKEIIKKVVVKNKLVSIVVK